MKLVNKSISSLQTVIFQGSKPQTKQWLLLLILSWWINYWFKLIGLFVEIYLDSGVTKLFCGLTFSNQSTCFQLVKWDQLTFASAVGPAAVELLAGGLDGYANQANRVEELFAKLWPPPNVWSAFFSALRILPSRNKSETLVRLLFFLSPLFSLVLFISSNTKSQKSTLFCHKNGQLIWTC